MIKNEREYKNIRSTISKFQKTLEYLAKAKADSKISARKVKIQEDATKSMIESLTRELKEYEEVRAGKHKIALEEIDVIPLHLIKARIALHWTQKDLARRVGITAQQIQRYEATDYASASLTTIKRISNIMQKNI